MKLDGEAARRAFEPLAERFALSVEQAASSALQLADVLHHLRGVHRCTVDQFERPAAHDDRHVGAGSQLAAHVGAVGIREAEVEQHELRALVRERLGRMDLELDVSEPALAELAKVGFDPVFGARPLKRAIQQRLENPLSKLLLEGRFAPKTRIQVSVDPVRNPGVFAFEGQALEA